MLLWVLYSILRLYNIELSKANKHSTYIPIPEGRGFTPILVNYGKIDRLEMIFCYEPNKECDQKSNTSGRENRLETKWIHDRITFLAHVKTPFAYRAEPQAIVKFPSLWL